MTECDRRCHKGSVKESYGTDSGKYHDLTTEEIIKIEDYTQYITALQAIIGDTDEQLSNITGVNSVKTLHVGVDTTIKKNELFSGQDILFLQALVTILKSDSKTAKTQSATHCAASCTGLCYTGCVGGCHDHCSNHTSGGGGGGGSSCSGDCTGGCGWKCTGFCTGNCYGTCKSSSGTCGVCGGGCDSSCRQGCSGTAK